MNRSSLSEEKMVENLGQSNAAYCRGDYVLVLVENFFEGISDLLSHTISGGVNIFRQCGCVMSQKRRRRVHQYRK